MFGNDPFDNTTPDYLSGTHNAQPSGPEYDGLKDWWQDLQTKREATQSNVAAATAMPTLKSGDRGAAVKTLQVNLISQGFLPAGSDDSIFLGQTEDAVRRFQGARGLPVTGVVDPATWAQLFGVRTSAVTGQGQGGQQVASALQSFAQGFTQSFQPSALSSQPATQAAPPPPPEKAPVWPWLLGGGLVMVAVGAVVVMSAKGPDEGGK